ncbi:hypothetical protein CEXT_103601, partial [Caerostris extrusa]
FLSSAELQPGTKEQFPLVHERRIRTIFPFRCTSPWFRRRRSATSTFLNATCLNATPLAFTREKREDIVGGWVGSGKESTPSGSFQNKLQRPCNGVLGCNISLKGMIIHVAIESRRKDYDQLAGFHHSLPKLVQRIYPN